MKIREDGTVQAGLRLDPELAEWCSKQACRRGIARNAWIVSLVWKERERLDKETAQKTETQPA